MSDKHPLDDPVMRTRIVRMLLILAPFAFAGSYLLAAVQGAEPKYALLIAVVALVMDLGAALVIYLLGSKSATALIVVRVVLALVGRR